MRTWLIRTFQGFGCIAIATSATAVQAIPVQASILTSSVSVGLTPFAAAVDSATNKVYVANEGSNSVSVIDGASNTVAFSVPVGVSPQGVAVDSKTDMIYVTNNSSNSVSVINGANEKVVASINVGLAPGPIAVNPQTNLIYVGNETGNSVSVIDGSSDSVIDTIGVPGPCYLAIDSTRNVLYALSGQENFVAVINAATDITTSDISIYYTNVHAVAVDPLTNQLYVSYQNAVAVFDLSNESLRATLPVLAIPFSLTLDPTTNSVLVDNYWNNSFQAIDVETNTLSAPTSVGPAPLAIATNATTGNVYVTNTGNNTVSVLVPPATAPSAPSITSVTRGNAQATVVWTDGSSNGSAITSESVYVYSGSTLVTTKTDCSGSPCTVTGLTNGTSYTFKVSDTNGVGEGALSSASSSVTPATSPGTPQSVSVVASGGQAVVSWSPPTSNGGSSITSYSVATTTGSHSCTYTVASPETDTCTVIGLTNGTSYTFVVTATNGVGAGTTSAGVAATVLFPGPVLKTAVGATHQATLTWSAPTVTNGKIVSFTGSVTDGSGHSFYCSASKTATKCTITGLTDLTTYTASVVAVENSGGTTSASSNAIAVTPAQPLTLPYLHPVALTSNHSATFVWGPAGGGDGQTTSYVVTVLNPNGSKFSSTTTSGNTATATGLTKGVKYSYTVAVSTSASVSGFVPGVTTKPVSFTAK